MDEMAKALKGLESVLEGGFDSGLPSFSEAARNDLEAGNAKPVSTVQKEALRAQAVSLHLAQFGHVGLSLR